MSSLTKNLSGDPKKDNNTEELSEGEEDKAKEKVEKNAKKLQLKSKQVENESENDEDDEEEDDDDEELKPGLLDLPLEVTGARERKKVDRLALSFHQPSKDKKTEIVEGKGEKLGEIPRIEQHLQKMRVDDLKPLHKLLYNRPGAPAEIKKNIRRFSGFPFDKDSNDFERKKSSLEKLTSAVLKKMCEAVDLERGGTKDEIITRILEFLLNPQPSGKKLAKPKAKKSSSNKNKKQKNSKKKDDDESKSDASGSQSENDESDKNDEDNEQEGKKTTKKSENKAKGKAVKRKNISNSEDSDDEPVVKKKAAAPPTDDELKDVIKRILDGANLEEITMKTVCKQVYAKFPEFDLSSRKEFIKTTVKSVS